MSRLLTDAEALARLKRATAAASEARELKAWATDRGLNYTYLCDVLAGRRKVLSPKIAKAIGLEKIEGWRIKR